MTFTDQEINEAVARKLGWKSEKTIKHSNNNCGPDCRIIEYDTTMPDYCHSIEAAWEIVDYQSGCMSLRDLGLYWICEFFVSPEINVTQRADTAPMAICLAFLKVP